MGAFDSVLVPCPECGQEQWFQSKGADNPQCREFTLKECPADVMSDINRYAPYLCVDCETYYSVKFKLKVTKVKVKKHN